MENEHVSFCPRLSQILDEEDMKYLFVPLLQSVTVEPLAHNRLRLNLRDILNLSDAELYKKEKDALVKIQSIARGRAARRLAERKRSYVNSAVKIQKLVRGNAARRHTKEMKKQALVLEDVAHLKPRRQLNGQARTNILPV